MTFAAAMLLEGECYLTPNGMVVRRSRVYPVYVVKVDEWFKGSYVRGDYVQQVHVTMFGRHNCATKTAASVPHVNNCLCVARRDGEPV